VPPALGDGRRSRCHYRSTQSGGTRRPMGPALGTVLCHEDSTLIRESAANKVGPWPRPR
jgi:hypothetical protein